jgi:hypothetical protein
MMRGLAIFTISPTSAVIPVTTRPLTLAVASAIFTFLLRPDVDRPKAKSPDRPSVSTRRARTCSDPMSSPQAVSTLESVVREMAGRAQRSCRTRTTSAVAKCCALLALPPLPARRILRPLNTQSIQASSIFGSALRAQRRVPGTLVLACFAATSDRPAVSATIAWAVRRATGEMFVLKAVGLMAVSREAADGVAAQAAHVPPKR